jgi:ectoine hydroxylase-related dioxygenase (phytanoyl-CoA dioxygenase family)
MDGGAAEPWPALGAAHVDIPATYARDGVAAIGSVLAPDELAVARAAFDALIASGVAGPYATIVHDGWRRSPELAALVPIVGVHAARALGVPELVLFHDSLLAKPSDGADMAWHQDFSYLPLDRSAGTTLWIALDDITETNGCIYYLRGSHLLGERRAAWGIFADDDPRSRLPALDVPGSELGIPAPTAAGGAIVHHTLILHRSPPNTSGRPRRAWALSLVAPDAVWAPDHAQHPRGILGARRAGDPLEADLPRVTATGGGRSRRSRP